MFSKIATEKEHMVRSCGIRSALKIQNTSIPKKYNDFGKTRSFKRIKKSEKTSKLRAELDELTPVSNKYRTYIENDRIALTDSY